MPDYTQFNAPAFRLKLTAIRQYLDDDGVTEIVINRPGEIWLGRQGHRYMDCVQVPDLTFDVLSALAKVIAQSSGQDSDAPRKPLLSATIPIDLRDKDDDGKPIPNFMRGGYRVQVIEPPAVAEGTIAVVIRKPALLQLSLDMYQAQGAFDTVNKKEATDTDTDDRLKELYRTGQWREFLRAAVKGHKTIMISAGTNTGKTTALNALLHEIDPQERIVTMEDAREVRPVGPNVLHLLYKRGATGKTDVTPVELLEAMLRLTPDRAIAGELRGPEAFMYMELINSGHSGSISTIHADSPVLMYERLAQMVMRFGATLTKPQIIDFAHFLIDVVVQFKRGSDGRRYVSEIQYANA